MSQDGDVAQLKRDEGVAKVRERDGEIPLKLPYCSPRRSLLMVPTWADSRRAVSHTLSSSHVVYVLLC